MKTKQTTNSTLTRRIFLGMLLLMFTSLSTFVFAQPPLPPNLPVGYFENAGLANPSNDYPLTFENAFWTVQINEQLVGCSGGFSFSGFITIAGSPSNGEPIKPVTVEIKPEEWSDDFKLNAKRLKELAGLGDVVGFFYATHISFQFKLNGVNIGSPIFPGGGSTISLPSLPYPCNCKRIVMDEKNHTILVYPGNCE